MRKTDCLIRRIAIRVAAIALTFAWLPVASGAVQVEFATYRQIAGHTGNHVADAATTDLDRDGDLDILVASAEYHGVAWYENLGNGTFARSVPLGPVVSGCMGVEAADMDGDGHDDVIASSDEDGSVMWFRNLGGGAFGTPQLIAESVNSPRFVKAGDLDGDGDQDVVVAGTEGLIGWYRNLSAGQFQPTNPIALDTPLLKYFGSFQVVDLDSDGDEDILVAGDFIALFLNHGSGFNPNPVYRFIPDLNYFGRDTAVGDMDGDGYLDIVLATETNSSGRLYLYRGNSTTIFSSGQTIAFIPRGTRGVDAADFDGDGDTDIVVSTGDFGWYENLGAATFSSLITISDIRSGGRALAADLSGDGLPDAVVTSGFEEGSVVWAEASMGSGLSGAIELSVSNLDDPGPPVARDFDLDGHLDVACVSRGDRRLTWNRNNGDGTFGPQVVVAFSNTLLRALEAGDLDLDGDDDIIVANASGLLRVENLGNGQFASAVPLQIPVGTCNSLVLYDLDGDGVLDVVYGSTFLGWNMGLGNGQFGPATTISMGGHRANGIDLADIDADGDIDVLVARSGDDSVLLYKNQGGMVLEPPVTLMGPPTSELEGAVRVFAADMNGDGLLDVVAQGSERLGYAFQEPNGTFDTDNPPSANHGFPTAMDVADFDRDGIADLLLGYSFTHDPPEVRFRRGLGTAGGGVAPAVVLTTAADYATNVLAADVDGDGDDDAVIVSIRDHSLGWCETLGAPEGGIGIPYCGPAAPNSSGVAGSIRLSGSADASVNALTLVAEQLPPQSFGYFIGSLTTGFVANPAGSQGNICVAGSVARFIDSAQSAGAAGRASHDVDLSAIPLLPQFALQAGDTFHFQYWHRDANPTVTSNFTGAVSLTFE